MTHLVTIRYPGQPQGKGRPRLGRLDNVYTPPKTVAYEKGLAWSAQADIRAAIKQRGLALAELPQPPFPCACALRVEVTALFLPPDSWSVRDRAAALRNEICHMSVPDWDNVGKMLDALKGVVWVDDSQIVKATVTKLWAELPMLIIEVHRAGISRAQYIAALAARIRAVAEGSQP